MSRIVFFTWPGGGNQPPAIGLAQRLRALGHDVAFAGYPGQSERFEAAGLRLEIMPGASRGWMPVDPSAVMALLLDRVWACPDHAADVADVIAREKPDLVVVDCLMGSVLAALHDVDIPVLVLVHSAPGALAPPGGPLDGLVLDPLNRIRADHGLDPIDTLWDAWQADDVLCASIPELDPLFGQIPPAFHWVGPIFEDASTEPGLDIRRDRTVVLVSFSSGPAWDQTSRIQRTVDGLAECGYRIVVTSGAVDPARIRVPNESVTVVSYLDHAKVLPRADVVVTHAGHGTLIAALAHGLPVVTIPNLAADQPALSAQTERLGAGIHLDDTATASDIRAAVDHLLTQQTYRAAADQLARQINIYDNQALTRANLALSRVAEVGHRAGSSLPVAGR